MSAGNPIIKCRVERELLAAIMAQIEQRNTYTRGIPWELSDFIRVAIREKLAHMKRSRKGHPCTDSSATSRLPETGASSSCENPITRGPSVTESAVVSVSACALPAPGSGVSSIPCPTPSPTKELLMIARMNDVIERRTIRLDGGLANVYYCKGIGRPSSRRLVVVAQDTGTMLYDTEDCYDSGNALHKLQCWLNGKVWSCAD